ncbi:unnamed protein product [Urochloa humidicola]
MSWRAGSSPMKAVTGSSSTGSGSQPRLIDCPKCHVRVVKIRSKQKETFNQVFYKCPNNIREDPSTCGFIRSEAQYESYVRGLDGKQEHNLEAVDEAQWFGDAISELTHQYMELKQEMGEVKQQLSSALCEIWNMKMQRSEVKEEKKEAFGMTNSVVLACCIGLVVGMFLTKMLK